MWIEDRPPKVVDGAVHVRARYAPELLDEGLDVAAV
jgi:hypothetical protein